MDVVIREMLPEDYKGKSFVHYQAWNETYTGLIIQDFLDSRSLEKCEKMTNKYPENTYVALIDDKVVGFACPLKSKEDDLGEVGAVQAIYVLKDYYDQKVGYKLMKKCLEILNDFDNVVVWVLKGNDRAIKFYQRVGFEIDGAEKIVPIPFDSELHEIRLTYKEN